MKRVAALTHRGERVCDDGEAEGVLKIHHFEELHQKLRLLEPATHSTAQHSAGPVHTPQLNSAGGGNTCCVGGAHACVRQRTSSARRRTGAGWFRPMGSHGPLTRRGCLHPSHAGRPPCGAPALRAHAACSAMQQACVSPCSCVNVHTTTGRVHSFMHAMMGCGGRSEYEAVTHTGFHLESPFTMPIKGKYLYSLS